MRIARLVVGVDFGDASLAAARWAATHLAPDAEVVLAHVVEEPALPAAIRAELPSAASRREARIAAMQGALRGLATLIGEARTTIHILVGDVPTALAELARHVDADLVCVGRGRARRGRARFGAGVATRLPSLTGVPTLVAAHGRATLPTRLLAAVGPRAPADGVLEAACALAAPMEARVDALYVLEPAARDAVAALRTPGDDDREQATRWLGLRALMWLAHLLESASADTSRAAPAIAMGDVGEELLRHAASTGAELLVVGAGGSTARLATWAAPCPVLLVPAPRETLTVASEPYTLAGRPLTSLTPSVLLDALVRGACLEAAVPMTLDLVRTDPLASGGRFAGDLLRGLMEVPGAYWSRHPTQYARYRAVVRAGAARRRALPVEQRLDFWEPIPPDG